MRGGIFFRILLSILIYTAANLLACIALPQDFSLLLCTGFGAVLSLPFLWLLYRKDQALRGTRPPLGKRRLPAASLILLLAFFSCLAFNGLMNLLLSSRFPAYEDSVRTVLYSPGLSEQLLCTGLLIPAAEELIFRGHIFFIIRDQSHFGTAAFFSALLFAFYHGNVSQGVYAFLMGLIAAYLAEKRRGLSFPYLFHACANIFSILLTHYLPKKWQNPGQCLLFIETLAALALTAACIRFIHRLFQQPKTQP